MFREALQGISCWSGPKDGKKSFKQILIGQSSRLNLCPLAFPRSLFNSSWPSLLRNTKATSQSSTDKSLIKIVNHVGKQKDKVRRKEGNVKNFHIQNGNLPSKLSVVVMLAVVIWLWCHHPDNNNDRDLIVVVLIASPSSATETTAAKTSSLLS